MLLFILSHFGFLLAVANANERINLNWTDTGVYMGKRPQYLNKPDEYLFGPLSSNNISPVLQHITPDGEILVPMPTNKDLPKNESEWNSYISKLENGIMDKIESGIEKKIHDFEIRTIQNITIMGGYWAPWQQKRCVKFTTAFLTALSEVKSKLSNKYGVRLNGVVGSNGGYVATESIPSVARMKDKFLDRLIIVDGRAYVDSTVNTSRYVDDLFLVNTGGDAFSLSDMVANHEGAKSAKRQQSTIKLFYIDPKGWNFPISAHISAMLNPNTEIWMKEYTGNGYSKKIKTTNGKFMNHLINSEGSYHGLTTITPAGTSTNKSQGGVSMNMEVTDINTENGDRLKDISKTILDSRPSQNELIWSVSE